jgi:type II secretion system protein G
MKKLLAVLLLASCGGGPDEEPQPGDPDKKPDPPATGEKKGAVVRTRSDLRILSAGLELYKLDCNAYPTSSQGLKALWEKPEGADAWKGPYAMGGVKETDEWGRPFVYRHPGKSDVMGFDLLSAGADGQEGTGDDIAKP